MGIYVLLRSNNIRQILNTPDAGAIIVCIAGFGVFLVSWIGCVGALKESKCLLNSDQIKKAMAEYPKLENDDPKKEAVNVLQWSMKCCGLETGPVDWTTVNLSFARNLPMSCCYDPNDESQYHQCTLTGSPQPFQKPCVKATEETFRAYGGIISGFAMGIAVVQLIASCFACMLANAIL
ncbi:CD63 antigen-like protein [Dinothrombium tinctorium]|uniref:CD63 antigen-like protein n=1 Tax=Dinothrombium tinctorium TaxID=1965070 RepID=A0A3S3NR40_9ACAR|nr:CD63 antigen-like protein [Dinothrombium tinctorium]RWS01823.1 CD63 antigen-like protein [Dinothrombium tinctorium]RWS04424.1 CD63 antigen-like protein [Dinothrombium tinctorium]